MFLKVIVTFASFLTTGIVTYFIYLMWYLKPIILISPFLTYFISLIVVLLIFLLGLLWYLIIIKCKN